MQVYRICWGKSAVDGFSKRFTPTAHTPHRTEQQCPQQSDTAVSLFSFRFVVLLFGACLPPFCSWCGEKEKRSTGREDSVLVACPLFISISIPILGTRRVWELTIGPSVGR
jgi:hypothetical protein